MRVRGILAGLVLFAAGHPALAGTYHVATNGNDAAAGSEAQPWRSVRKALAVAVPAAVPSEVVIHEGVYRGDVTVGERADSQGGPRSRLVIRAASKPDGGFEEVIFDAAQKIGKAEPVAGKPGVFKAAVRYGDNDRPQMWETDTRTRYTPVADLAAVEQFPASFWRDKSGLHFHTSDDCTPESHDIGASRDEDGIFVWRTDVTLRGLQVRSGRAGIDVRGANAVVEDCRVWNARRAIAISEVPGARVRRCRVDDSGTGFYSHGIHTVVEDCQFFKIRDGFMVPMFSQDDCAIHYYTPADEGEVRRNLCVGFRSGFFAKCKLSAFTVEFNTFVNTGSVGCRGWHSNNVFRGNLIVGTGSPIHGNTSDGMVVPGSVVDFDCYWSTGGTAGIKSSIAMLKKFGTASCSVIADPLFAAPAQGDYRLRTNSPCLKLGPNGETCGAFPVVGPDFQYVEPPVVKRTASASATIRPAIAPIVRTAARGEPMTFFVSPKGDDHPDRGSRESPLQTIQYAGDHALPGDRIVLLPGLYPGATRLTHGGREGAPITIEADQPGTAILDGHHDAYCVLRLTKAPHVVIRNLEVRWFMMGATDSAGIHVEDSPHVSIIGCRIWNDFWGGWASGRGILADRSAGLVADHNTLFRLDTGIVLRDSPRSRVTYNTVTAETGGAVVFKDSAVGSVFRNNSLAFGGNYRLTIDCESVKELETFDSDYNNFASNLKIIESGMGPPDPHIEKERITTDNPHFKFMGTKSSVLVRPRTGNGSHFLPYRSLTRWREAYGKDRHSIFKDPKYADTAAYDFHIQPDSPNLRAGENGITIGAHSVVP